jgi:hypothetical protein
LDDQNGRLLEPNDDDWVFESVTDHGAGDEIARNPLVKSGGKKIILVFRFQVWDHNMGENVWAPRMATLEAVKPVNGSAEQSTETLVEESEIDGIGFYPLKISPQQ